MGAASYRHWPVVTNPGPFGTFLGTVFIGEFEGEAL